MKQFIENLAASKYSMWALRQTNVIINNIGYVHFACSEEVSCPVLQKVKQVCVSIAWCKEREVMGTFYFFFHESNRHEQVL